MIDSIRTEYGIRDASGGVEWPLPGAESWIVGGAYVSTSDPKALHAALVSERQGRIVVTREVTLSETTVFPVELPSTPGSVVRKDGRLFALSDDTAATAWDALTDVADPELPLAATSEELAGAEVLFIAPEEVTA